MEGLIYFSMGKKSCVLKLAYCDFSIYELIIANYDITTNQCEHFSEYLTDGVMGIM